MAVGCQPQHQENLMPHHLAVSLSTAANVLIQGVGRGAEQVRVELDVASITASYPLC